MKEAVLYQKLKNKTVKCGVCQRRCVVPEGQTGYCKTRVNKNGKLYSITYGVVSCLNNDPIEKKPVYHFRPGSFCLSLGTFGCNFRCKFCQNWEIAWADGAKEAEFRTKISPEKAIEMAKKYASSGIAITYNEPAIWLEYSLDVFKLAKSKQVAAKHTSEVCCRRNTTSETNINQQLYTCWVTNGYATPEAIDLVAPYLDIYRVDLKSFDDKFYQKLINVPKAQTIFETTKYVRQKYPDIHMECVTNIIPTLNDDKETLAAIASWISKNLGNITPWHVTRFFPYAKLTNIPPTSPETLFNAREIGLKEGLKFVYIGNLDVDEEDDTFCPKCGNLAIRRKGNSVKMLTVTNEGKCSKCGEELNIKLPPG